MVSLRLSLVAALSANSDACTCIAVGKDASASGAPMVGHSEDSGLRTNDIRLVRVPRKRWPSGSMRPLHKVSPGYPRIVDAERAPDYAPVNDQLPSQPLAYIPQVEETYAYWDTDYGVHNEHGLAFGESTCTANTVGWSSDLPYGYNAAGIAELSKIALERCKTARCAVQTMGDIAVELGFFSEDSGDPAKPAYSGSAECLGVADATGELWIFNILTGKNNASSIWAAQRMPSDAVVAVGNTFTIRKMNLSDSANFLYSPGVSELAVEKGWWSPNDESSPEIFDFFGAYGYTPGSLGEQPFPPNLGDLLGFYSSRRMWRIFSLLSPVEGAKLDRYKSNLPKTEDPLPCWVSAPQGSVTLEMVQNAYRDHYEGTEFDLTQGMSAGPFGNPNRGPGPPGVVGLWERATSMYRTTWSFVNEARPEDRSVLWFGYDAPHGTVYLPFYGAASDGAPQSYHSHEGTMGKFSFDVAYWPFGIINSFSDVNFQLINGDVRLRAAAIESEAQTQRQLWEAEAARASTKEEALEILTRRSNAFAADVVSRWWDYAFSVFAKFGRKAITFNDTEHGAMAQYYPQWWVESPAVGYTIWNAEGPFHGVTEAEQAAQANLRFEDLRASCASTQLAATSTSPALLMLAGFGAAAVAVSLYVAGLRHGRRSAQSAQVAGYVACA